MRNKINTERSPRAKSQPSSPTLENPHFETILDLAESVNQLHHQMAEKYTPIVKDLIQSQNRNQQQIEHLLDQLLDCACIPEGLNLFRALCCYYFTLNPTDPTATASYVNAYREMWDSEDEEKHTP